MPSDRTKEILEKLMRVVDELVEESFVVTDGVNVSGILTNAEAGAYLAQRLRRETTDETWGCYTIPVAIKIAYERGRVDTLSELRRMQMKQAEGKENGEDQELRDSELQQEEQES